MKYSKHIRQLAGDIASNYARYSKSERLYHLQLEEVADFDLHELSAALIQENSMLASEATGADNPQYPNMLEALTMHMCRLSDKEIQADFAKTWRDGITEYCKDIIMSLVDDAISEMNFDSFADEDYLQEQARPWI